MLRRALRVQALSCLSSSVSSSASCWQLAPTAWSNARSSTNSRSSVASAPSSCSRGFAAAAGGGYGLSAALEARMKELQGVYDAATESLMKQLSPEEIVKANKDLAKLTPVVDAYREVVEMREEAAALEEVVKTSAGDVEMRKMAEEELSEVSARLEEATEGLALLLVPDDPADEREAIIEVRAGTGGDEAALFAGDLLKMYERYATIRRWKFELLTASEGELEGVKEASASISGEGVYGRLKFESGVHRVQRVPLTETQGRVHTSTASVAVLPQATEVDVVIRDEDIRIDTYRSSGAGGQHVNTTNSAVRVTHVPTGTVVAIQDERSQHKNKAKALKVLRARIFERQMAQQREQRAEMVKGLIGSADRSERIRTYNFQQARVKDHRVNVMAPLDAVLRGEAFDEFIDALVTYEREQRLQALEGDSASPRRRAATAQTGPKDDD